MDIARQENPAFIEALVNKTHAIENGIHNPEAIRDYSDEIVLVLHKYNKEDPKFAYYLAKAHKMKVMQFNY